jgi:ubiquinone/menaquinone biosynthesis C-methylase UbiE
MGRGAAVFACAVGFLPHLNAFQLLPSKSYDIYSAPFHPFIHNFGNVGPLGWLHANLAGYATRLIDKHAYNGVNMRQEVAEQMAAVFPNDIQIVEVGTGVGTLTTHLASHFENIIGMDTSKEMIEVAEKNITNVDFRVLNGVYVRNFTADVVISSMVMHELPQCAHIELVSSMLDSVSKKRGEVWIIDIDPCYTPSESMRMGEPFVDDYLKDFHSTMDDICKLKNANCSRVSIIPEHVFLWVFQHA